ncbi:MAG: hypothetical protein M3541_18375 [Acidobacteriota bacterium]|nr:hypothetical protein [Acidobacteriota bacterium]MDQ3420710.1 hypothetical protein [Acidobacteriota bacterium]
MPSALRKIIQLTPVIGLAATLGATLAMSSGTLGAAQDRSPGQPSADARRIEGTWRVQITLVNCQSGLPFGAAFQALATFGREGTLITADGGLNPATRTAGHGVWRFLSPGAFEALSEAFLFTNGVRSGTQRIRQEIQIVPGGSEFTSRVSSQVLDLNGQPVFVGCAMSEGQRME